MRVLKLIMLLCVLCAVMYSQPTATAVGFIEVVDGKEKFANVKTTKPLPVIVEGGINLSNVSIDNINIDTNAQHHTNVLLAQLNETILGMGGGGNVGGGGTIDLSNYVTTSHLDAALNNYTTTANLNNMLSSYVLQSALGNFGGSGSVDLSSYVTNTDLNTKLNNYVTGEGFGNSIGGVYSYFNTKLEDYALKDHVHTGGGGSVDLSSYVTNTDLNTRLNNYVTTTMLGNTLNSSFSNFNNHVDTKLEGYLTISDFDDFQAHGLDRFATMDDLAEYTTNIDTKLQDYATVADLEDLDSRLVNYSLVGHNHSDYVTVEDFATTLQDFATVESVSTSYSLKGHPHEITDIVGLSEMLSTVNNSTSDTTAQHYNNLLLVRNNELLAEYLGYGTGYNYKCDSIFATATRFLTTAERDTTKKMIIDYISIQTDSANIGYEITVKKLTAPVSSKIVFKNERLVGNVTVNFNLVGTPLVLQPDEHLFIQKTLTNGGAKAKAWLSVKYKQR